ncbi:MAG: hypothetical protein VKI82_04395 [Leptolyngbya sp.]|nr:hypothetical protein [Leptolyngbya sp.]
MNQHQWIAVTLGLMMVGTGDGVAQAQANLSNQQLAEQWVNCLQGRPSTVGDCGAVQGEFNRRANEIRQRDLSIQRGAALPNSSTTPAASPASPTTPAARTASPSPRPANSNRVASEDDPSCAGREVVIMAGGYLCR